MKSCAAPVPRSRSSRTCRTRTRTYPSASRARSTVCGSAPLLESKALDYPKVNTRVAEEVEGVRLIDPTPIACPEKECPAVIGDVLVYRNGAHLTATYVRTLTPWLDKQLPEPHRLTRGE